ncbi:sensor histidine kinase [Amphibacillus sediminis]|uniref:sensor histidine kinase n=1 Tax=Amphibacillus sediminis TaxID=360185 RepID=UPI0008338011|nr:HAMP domain-containing sensor histidine kinase [Amphibacillus sediminis]
MLSRIRAKVNQSIVVKSTITNIVLFGLIFLALGYGIYQAFSSIMFEGAILVLEDHSRVISDFVKDGYIDIIPSYAEDSAISVTMSPASGAVNSSEVVIDGVEIIYRFIVPGLTESYDVVITKTLEKEWESIRTMLIFLIGASVILVAFILFITTITTRRTVKPIQEMINTINNGGLDVRLDVANSQNELKRLAETFNKLLDGIWKVYQNQERFVSDASHELRTPLLVIQGYSDLLERWGKNDESVQTEAVASIRQEAVYMNKLVERLLFLANADQNRLKVDLKEVELLELLNSIIHDSTLIDDSHTYRLEAEKLHIRADASLIKQLIRILLDNSAKYSIVGGEITVRAYQKDQDTIIEVEDHGPGVSEENLSHIFERFYKADNSRTRKRGGTGLGLSIARRIVEEHSGKIFASNTSKGLLITILFPRIS